MMIQVRSLLRASCCALAASLLLHAPAQAQLNVFGSNLDLSGTWRALYHEDQPERVPGPEMGDYTGIPINDDGRRRAETWDASILTLPEMQCTPHPANYTPYFGNLRTWSQIDMDTLEVEAWHFHFWAYTNFRTVYMDGRPHPSDFAPHTWQGFSTGEWHGDVLKVTTTHLKTARIRRNGVDRSDQATLKEFITQHDNGVLTIISIVEDPVYLGEPFIHSRNYVRAPDIQMTPWPCRPVVEVDRPIGHVPHYLPGQNPFVGEVTDRWGVPLEAVRGGPETLYPEYAEKLRQMHRDAQ